MAPSSAVASSLALLAACLALNACGAAHQQTQAEPANPGLNQLVSLGHAPRPVNAAEREARGFSPPRDVGVILAELDNVPARMINPTDDPSTWAAARRVNDAIKRQRIDLISELEEAGYAGPRLHELLRQKLVDIRDVWPRDKFPASSFDELRKEIARRHANADVAVEAQAESLLELVYLITLNGFHVHPRDYEALANVEVKRKDSRMGGLLLLEALHFESDDEVRRKWHDWMIENLEPAAMGRRFVVRQRSFNHPVRLRGEGLDGSRIDTADWLGEVVLVDFWGTWCMPCLEAMPELQRLQEKHGDKGLRILGILCDNKFDKASTWLRKNGYAWPQLVDRSLTDETYDQHRIAVQYAIGGFPTLWIIDRQGVLRCEADRDDLEALVQGFLNEPRPTDAPSGERP